MMPLPRRRPLPALLAVLLLPLALPSPTANAAKALIAVAANFNATAESLAAQFEADSEHELVIISGSTGKLYTQIRNGAPFDVFLAADVERPQRLAAAGGSPLPPRTYASGQLGLWVRGSRPDANDLSSRLTGLRKVALANPSLAPYGVAAMAVIDRLAVRDKLAGRLAYGENVAQAYALIAAGAADGGLIAWSILQDGDRTAESQQIPADWHPPIDQDAVLLNHGADNPAAQAFFDYLYSPPARSLIEARGYLVPDS